MFGGSAKDRGTLNDFDRGDRVRLSDGRIVELAWPFWWHGTKKIDQDKIPPVAWFVREILEDFGGGEVRSEPFDLESDEIVESVVSRLRDRLRAPMYDERDDRDSIDPLLNRPARGVLI